MKRVTVVIPNWNGKDLLGSCLKSLYHQEFQDFETVVVDNGSTDKSVPFVQESFPQVRVIRFEMNTGFSAAVNAGILAAESPYIALLNNDTEVHPLWLKELLGGLEADPKAGSAASKILFSHDSRLVNSAGDEFSWFGVAYQRGNRSIDGTGYNHPCFVFSACAGAALYRREVFDKVGLFDESFFAYMEDVDLGFRLQLDGYPCLYVPSAIVYHKHQQTSNRIPQLRVYWTERNKCLVLIKNLPVFALLCTFPFISFYYGLNFLRFIQTGQIRIYCKAVLGIIRLLPLVLAKRRSIQKTRVITSLELIRKMRFIESLGFIFSRRLSSWIQRAKEKKETE